MQGIHGMSGSISPDALGSDDEGYDGGPSPISSAALGAFPNLYDDEGQPITSTSVINAGRLFGLGAGDTAETVYAETHDADNFTLRCVFLILLGGQGFLRKLPLHRRVNAPATNPSPPPTHTPFPRHWRISGDLWAKKENPYMLFNQAGKGKFAQLPISHQPAQTHTPSCR